MWGRSTGGRPGTQPVGSSSSSARTSAQRPSRRHTVEASEPSSDGTISALSPRVRCCMATVRSSPSIATLSVQVSPGTPARSPRHHHPAVPCPMPPKFDHGHTVAAATALGLLPDYYPRVWQVGPLAGRHRRGTTPHRRPHRAGTQGRGLDPGRTCATRTRSSSRWPTATAWSTSSARPSTGTSPPRGCPGTRCAPPWPLTGAPGGNQREIRQFSEGSFLDSEGYE